MSSDQRSRKSGAHPHAERAGRGENLKQSASEEEKESVQEIRKSWRESVETYQMTKSTFHTELLRLDK